MGYALRSDSSNRPTKFLDSTLSVSLRLFLISEKYIGKLCRGGDSDLVRKDVLASIYLEPRRKCLQSLWSSRLAWCPDVDAMGCLFSRLEPYSQTDRGFFGGLRESFGAL